MNTFGSKTNSDILAGLQKVQQLNESSESWMARLYTALDEKAIGSTIIRALDAVRTTNGMRVPDEKLIKNTLMDAYEIILDDLLVDWDKKTTKSKDSE